MCLVRPPVAPLSLAAAAIADLEAPPAPALPRTGRRKLWQIRHQYHCPLIGSCLPVEDLRRIARRAGIDPRPMSDYALHVHAVSHAQERTPMAEALQREFDTRFAATVRRFAGLTDPEALLAGWQAEVAAGNIAAALWAAFSHPAAEGQAAQIIYGEIHMLSHQIGAANRADLKRLATLEQELAEARAAQRRDRQRAEQRIVVLEARLRERERQVQAAQCQAAEQAAAAGRLRAAAEAATRAAAVEAGLRREIEQRDRRLDGARGEIGSLRRRLEAAEAEIAALLAELAAAEREADGGAVCDACPQALAATSLEGRCLLCIGGRESLVGHYRSLVERSGGRFLHHDGGIEDNPRRLEATLACADAVVCQAGCVSHAAYWKLKEFCKRHGKPCVYLRRAGVTSFARGIGALAGGAQAR